MEKDLKLVSGSADASGQLSSWWYGHSQCVPRWLVRSMIVWKSGIGPPVLNRYRWHRRVSVAGSRYFVRSTTRTFPS